MRSATKYMTEDPQTHASVRAWAEAAPARRLPSRVVALKVQEGKSAVYRLEEVGDAGDAVVAKRCPLPVATVERTVYEKVLPNVGLPHLHYYGFVTEPQGQFAWLFVEDAGDAAIHRSDPEQKRLAALWLARLHAAAAALALTVELPDRTPSFYREQAGSVRQAIQQGRGNPSLQPAHWTVLDAIDAQMALIDDHWDEIEAVCAAFPTTLVHGDFVRKNVRMRSGHDGIELLALDWETAGWGVPAIDLCRFVGAPVKPDLPTYHRALRDQGQPIELEQIQDLAHLGSIFRLVSATYWASLRLNEEWIGKCMVWMECYRSYMVTALQATRWGRCMRS